MFKKVRDERGGLVTSRFKYRAIIACRARGCGRGHNTCARRAAGGVSGRDRNPHRRRRQSNPPDHRSDPQGRSARIHARRPLSRCHRYAAGDIRPSGESRRQRARSGQGLSLWPRDGRRLAHRDRCRKAGAYRQSDGARCRRKAFRRGWCSISRPSIAPRSCARLRSTARRAPTRSSRHATRLWLRAIRAR